MLRFNQFFQISKWILNNDPRNEFSEDLKSQNASNYGFGIAVEWLTSEKKHGRG